MGQIPGQTHEYQKLHQAQDFSMKFLQRDSLKKIQQISMLLGVSSRAGQLQSNGDLQLDLTL